MPGAVANHGGPATVPSPEVAPLTIVSDPDARRWDEYVERHPSGTVEHLFAWREIFSGVFGQQPVYLAATRGGHIAGVLPLVKFTSLLFGRSLVSLPYANYAGLLASSDEAAEALVAHAVEIGRGFGASHVELRHVDRQLPRLPCREHKVGARLALPQTTDALWGRIDRKVRNQIRKAQKEGLVVDEGTEALIADFYQVFARNMRDLGTPVFPRQLFVDTLSRFDARVFVARHRGVAVAGAIALGWRDTILVPWASSLREYRHLCANMLVYWSMLEYAVGHDYRVFDFGRSSPGGGTHQFKQQWGATDVPLHWEYAPEGTRPPDHGTSNPRLQLFIRAWQRLPLPVANLVGPRVIRQIP